MHMAYAYIYSTHINCAVSELRQSRERERERERESGGGCLMACHTARDSAHGYGKQGKNLLLECGGSEFKAAAAADWVKCPVSLPRGSRGRLQPRADNLYTQKFRQAGKKRDVLVLPETP